MNTLDSQVASDIVIFGVLGDLSRRKLLPALFHLENRNAINPLSRIVGVARGTRTVETFKARILESLNTFVKTPIDNQILARFIARFVYQSLDMQKTDTYGKLANKLAEGNETRIYYFSTPSEIYGALCEGLAQAKLITKNDRVVLEKPIGNSLSSSKVINEQVLNFFTEKKIYRIDHYLGKESVLNLLVLRFSNPLFMSNWDKHSIDHIQVTLAESVGIEGRYGFYDQAGQMRDMIQNHMLQILSLLAMEPPADLNAESIRTEKLKIIKALSVIDHHNVKNKTVRGQYVNGDIKGVSVPGYLAEEGVNTHSKTETFVVIKAEVNNARWSGVPFYLRSGKRMPVKQSEIVVHFKRQPDNLFEASCSDLPANKLTIRLHPDEGLDLHIMNKTPDIASQIQIQENKLDLNFHDVYKNKPVISAYERLILEILHGNQSLFVSRDEVEAAWFWVDSIIIAWQNINELPQPYVAGSWGPDTANDLIAGDKRWWVNYVPTN